MLESTYLLLFLFLTMIFSLSSGLFLTLAKLSGQILLTMAFYAFVLDQQISNNWFEFFLLSLPTFSIVGLHNIKDFVVNFWCADKNDNSGYKLEIKFLPTAANTEAESWRFLSNSKAQMKERRWRVKYSWMWWFRCFCGGSQLRALYDPDIFNFVKSAKSRLLYRRRFLLSLGKLIHHL